MPIRYNRAICTDASWLSSDTVGGARGGPGERLVASVRSLSLPRRAPLLELDPELGTRLSDQHRRLADTHLVMRVEQIDPGERRLPDDLFDAQGGLGLLVVGGLGLRRLRLVDHTRVAAELLGPGDLLRPWQDDGDHEVFPFTAAWRIIEPVTVAVIDATATERLTHFPALTDELVSRVMDRARRLAGHLVIAQLTAVQSRLLVELWHLAEHWGRVRPDGVLLRLPLTHEMLGQMIGAHRPSITSALTRLSDGGLVQHSGGDWLLTQQPPEVTKVLGTARRPRPSDGKRPLAD